MHPTSAPTSSAPVTRNRGSAASWHSAIVTMAVIALGPAALAGAASAASPVAADAAAASAAIVPVPAAETEDPVVTTSTLPVDNRELGNSLPQPNRGAAPPEPR